MRSRPGAGPRPHRRPGHRDAIHGLLVRHPARRKLKVPPRPPTRRPVRRDAVRRVGAPAGRGLRRRVHDRLVVPILPAGENVGPSLDIGNGPARRRPDPAPASGRQGRGQRASRLEDGAARPGLAPVRAAAPGPQRKPRIRRPALPRARREPDERQDEDDRLRFRRSAATAPGLAGRPGSRATRTRFILAIKLPPEAGRGRAAPAGGPSPRPPAAAPAGETP